MVLNPLPSRLREARKNRAADRRAKVWQLRIAGATIHQIAQELGVSDTTIEHDIRLTVKQLTEQRLDAAEDWRQLHLQRMEALLLGVWQQARAGDPAAMKAALDVMNRQAQLLGLDAPKRTELTGADGGPIELDQQVTVSEAERDHRILAILERARERSHPPALPAGPDLAATDGATDGSLAQ